MLWPKNVIRTAGLCIESKPAGLVTERCEETEGLLARTIAPSV